MKKIDVVKTILGHQFIKPPQKQSAQAFAPSNVALCKYWGKRNQEINLPQTSSLSISLGDRGTYTKIKLTKDVTDKITLNGKIIDKDTVFVSRLVSFLNLFRSCHQNYFDISITSTVPIAAGLASSASGFASIVLTLNELYNWNLTKKELSILARMGSGSASRSIWSGFVEWHSGVREDGMDSHGESLPNEWPEFCIGLLLLSQKKKLIGSSEAMQRTVDTSTLYSKWSPLVQKDLSSLKKALLVQDFELLGRTAESNANAMHATMLASWPPISYYLPETILAMRQIWSLRQEGLSVYYTQDAGPNLKLLFLEKNTVQIKKYFSELEIVRPFLTIENALQTS